MVTRHRFHAGDFCTELKVSIKSKFYESFRTVKHMPCICASVTPAGSGVTVPQFLLHAMSPVDGSLTRPPGGISVALMRSVREGKDTPLFPPNHSALCSPGRDVVTQPGSSKPLLSHAPGWPFNSGLQRGPGRLLWPSHFPQDWTSWKLSSMNTEIQIVYCLMPIPTLLYEPITDLPLHQPT